MSELGNTEFKRLRMEDFENLDCDIEDNESQTASYLMPPKIYRQTLDADNLISVCTKKLEKDPQHK